MNDHPTDDPRWPYYVAVNDAEDALEDALDAIRAETRAGRVSPEQAAHERAGLLGRHLELLRKLRAEHHIEENQ